MQLRERGLTERAPDCWESARFRDFKLVPLKWHYLTPLRFCLRTPLGAESKKSHL